MKKIGNVVIDYSFYRGKDLYSDGEIENTILEAVQNENENDLLKNSHDWPILYHLSDIRENLLEWYPIKKNESVLEIGSGCGAMTGILAEKALSVTCIDLSEKRSLINAHRHKAYENIKIILGNFKDIAIQERFDYVTMIGVLEYSGLYVGSNNPYLLMLNMAKKFLKPNGKIIVAIENKTGLKYWNGAVEDHTGKAYSGLNDYVEGGKVRTFSKNEIIELLKMADINEYCFYYPIPDYKLPDCIYTDSYLPKVGEIRVLKKDYSSSRISNFYDATGYDQICYDNMFQYFANSFLFVCGEKKQHVDYIKYNRERTESYRTAIQIESTEEGRRALKRSLSMKGQDNINSLKKHEKDWIKYYPNLETLSGKIVNNKYIVPYVEGKMMDEVLYTYRGNVSVLIKEIKKIFRNFLTPISEAYCDFEISKEFVSLFGNDLLISENERSLKCSNLDLSFHNLKILDNNHVIALDCEWVFDFPIPYEYLVWRALNLLYNEFSIYLKNQISKNDFILEFDIKKKNLVLYEDMEKAFMEYVHGRNCNEIYTLRYVKNVIMPSYKIW